MAKSWDALKGEREEIEAKIAEANAELAAMESAGDCDAKAIDKHARQCSKIKLLEGLLARIDAAMPEAELATLAEASEAARVELLAVNERLRARREQIELEFRDRFAAWPHGICRLVDIIASEVSVSALETESRKLTGALNSAERRLVLRRSELIKFETGPARSSSAMREAAMA